MSLEDQCANALDKIRHSIATNRLAHAYLVVGPPRGAAKTLAEQVLQLLFCTGAAKPCNECRGCRLVREHGHPDVFWVEPRLKTRIIAIDAIRKLNRDIFQTSYEGGWKAAVVVAADRMGAAGKDETGNAFLKTLEEPPPRTLFLLLSDAPEAVMHTIRSRCHRLVLSCSEAFLLDPAWRDALFTILMPPVTASPLLTAAWRTLQMSRIMNALKDRITAEEKAAAVEEEEPVAPVETESVFGEGEDSKAGKAMFNARVEARWREERVHVIRALLGWYRDLMICHCGGDPRLLRFPEQADYLRRTAQALTYRQVLGNVAIVENLNRQLAQVARADDTVVGVAFAQLSA